MSSFAESSGARRENSKRHARDALTAANWRTHDIQLEDLSVQRVRYYGTVRCGAPWDGDMLWSGTGVRVPSSAASELGVRISCALDN